MDQFKVTSQPLEVKNRAMPLGPENPIQFHSKFIVHHLPIQNLSFTNFYYVIHLIVITTAIKHPKSIRD